MPGVKKYSETYIGSCRKKAQTDVKAYEQLTSVSETFESVFFNNMVVVLDQMFVHRMRGQEGKDGNPLNEVRMTSNSILSNGGKLLADNTIKYDSTKSVLKIPPGPADPANSEEL